MSDEERRAFLSAGTRTANLAVTATVGGIAANVTFAGLAPSYVGLYQVNVQIPANAPSGVAVPIVITFSSATTTVSTQPGVTVAVQ